MVDELERVDVRATEVEANESKDLLRVMSARLFAFAEDLSKLADALEVTERYRNSE